jgi:hypothetical protein
VLRMMVISYLTEERHLHDLQAALEAAAKAVKSRAGQEPLHALELVHAHTYTFEQLETSSVSNAIVAFSGQH